MSFAALFLGDSETYSGPDGYICIFDSKYSQLDDLNDVKDHKDISILLLLRELKNKNELLPLEIQKLIAPIMDVDLDN